MAYDASVYMTLTVPELKKRFENEKWIAEKYLNQLKEIQRIRNDPAYADQQEAKLKIYLQDCKIGLQNIATAMQAKGG